MITIIIVIVIIGIILYIISYWQLQRDLHRYNDVCRFYSEVENLGYAYQERHLKDTSIDELICMWNNFVNKYTFKELFNSNRKLVLENWYTLEEINKIKS